MRLSLSTQLPGSAPEGVIPGVPGNWAQISATFLTQLAPISLHRDSETITWGHKEFWGTV